MAELKRNLRPQNLRLALRASSGLTVGHIYPLVQQRNILGRSVDAAVPLEDKKVSRKHATVDIQNGFHFVVDLGSINGTYINGKKLAKAQILQPGDELRIGSTVFVVELMEHVRSHAPQAFTEATRAIVLSKKDIDRELSSEMPASQIPPSAASVNATGARWISLVDLAPRDALFTQNSRRWMGIFVALGTVGAALWFSWH